MQNKVKGHDYPVRGIQPRVYRKLKDLAAKENRSLNGQIVHILKLFVEAL